MDSITAAFRGLDDALSESPGAMERMFSALEAQLRIDRLLAATEGSLDGSALDQFIAALGGTLISTGLVAATV